MRSGSVFAHCGALGVLLGMLATGNPASAADRTGGGRLEYLAESAITVEDHAAPGMKIRPLSEEGKTRVFLLSFAANDVLLSGLKDFARRYRITSATVSAVGALQSAEYGWYDTNRRQLRMHYLDEQVEVTSLAGNLGVMNGEPIAHLHFSGAKADGQVVGGHLVKAVVGPGLELMVTATPGTIQRKLYPAFEAFGLADD